MSKVSRLSLMYTPAFNRWSYWVPKTSEPWKTWNWIMVFERLEKSNEKHQCVIVKTNKQFWEQQKQMLQPATEMQQGWSRAGWRWAVWGGLLPLSLSLSLSSFLYCSKLCSVCLDEILYERLQQTGKNWLEYFEILSYGLKLFTLCSPIFNVST